MMKFKIKTVKSFNREDKKEIVKYFIKRKFLFFWYYEINIDNMSIVSAGFLFSIWFHSVIVAIMCHYFSITTLHIISCFVLLRILYLYTMNLLLKYNFKTFGNATEYIQDRIRKSKLKNYKTSEEIIFTYKDNKIDIEKL
jgi:hypothetical protein